MSGAVLLGREGRPAPAAKTKPAKGKRAPPGVYLIDRILDKRVHDHYVYGNIIQYRVKWTGYTERESTWEPSWELPTEVVQAYENPERARLKTALPLLPNVILFSCANPTCTRIECRPLEFQCCSGCGTPAEPDGPSPLAAPRYCSRACQEVHWTASHARVCPGL